MIKNLNRVFIIAEAGLNHNGSFQKALEMIKVAKETGADAIKFQTAVPELVITHKAQKAEYQIEKTGSKESQLEMVKKIHLPLNSYQKLKAECKKQNLEFMSTAFDAVSIETLDKVGLNRMKIPSGEVTNLPYLRQIGSIGKPIIMSTGMANLEEVRTAIEILVSTGMQKRDITILHCNTDYPTSMEDVNLEAMLTIKHQLGVEIGYSDHTLGIEVSIAAVAKGATIIEKHFTLDRNLVGPDHAASLEPDEFKLLVQSVRNIEKALGDGEKKPSQSELKNIPIIRRSIVAKKPIKKGEKFSEENITVKRPGTGISPMEWDNIVGNISNYNYDMDDLILW